LGRISKKDRIESRPLAFHNRLRKGYLELARKYPQRIKVVDARGSLDDIYERVEKVLDCFCRKP
jgi:dTMP kinase